ncbi:Serine/threonine-protein kinase CTR1 OS=Arabidopsis thaliana GN=CTR1 PE=1 SV=1 [Rhizoctonia solani AG-1 IB]|uniref:Serine/threonine-protein kinase CTR1 n=1 Tax=Thanatephorus cucumeris (strain AG1-IB / isolate 7/3/14) TaxID=1108050 RepID=A0A0B7FI02_THACB|nr:Serine/threonine-protein kinase CTR1 OS=Arabidopsis thaliana GN=CTR1 PE=1 SV=1 [Rhizoctonia solani AG-1 IB]
MEHVALDLTGLVTKTQPTPFARGGFADIWLGELNWLITSPVQQVAIKVPHVTSRHLRGTEREEIERRLGRELKTWRTLRHPNILPLLGTCTDLGTFPFALPLPSMITEFCPLGTLADYLVEHDEPIDDLAMAHDIASAVVYMHEIDPPIVHGDLKAENILISQNRTPRISDFGLSRAVKNSDAPTGYTTSTFHGSMRWMSPELHDADEYGRPPPFTPASDIWAFGMVMLEIETCNIPWSHIVHEPAVILAVMRGNTPPLPKDKNIPPPVWTLMQGCWKQDPAERGSMRNVMSHIDLLKFQRDVQDPSSPVGQRSLSSSSSIRSRSSSILSSPTTSPLTLEPSSIHDADTVLTKARRAYTQRDVPLARQLYSTAAAAFASGYHQLRHAQTLTELARVDKPSARVHLEVAMEILSSPHQPMYQIRVQRMIAEVENTSEAKRLLLDCRSSARKGGWVDEEGAALIQLGQVHAAAGEDDDAYGWFSEAIRLGEKQDKATIKSEALEGRGGVSMRRGDKEAAVVDFEQAAVEYRHCGGGGRRGVTRVLAKIRDISGESTGGTIDALSESTSSLALSFGDSS